MAAAIKTSASKTPTTNVTPKGTSKPAAPNPRTPGTQYRSTDGTIKTYGNADGTPYVPPNGSNSTGASAPAAGSAGSAYDTIPSTQAFVDKEYSGYQDALKQYVDPVLQAQQSYLTALQGRGSIEDYYNNLRNEKGLPQTEDTMKALEGNEYDVSALLRDLPDNVTQRLQGTFATEGARNRVVAAETTPLSKNLQGIADALGKTRSGYSDAVNYIQNALQLHQTQQQQDLEPIAKALEFAGFNLDQGRTTLRDKLQADLSGFSSDQSTALAKISAILKQQSDTTSQKNELDKITLQNTLKNNQPVELTSAQNNTIVTAAQDLTDRGVPPDQILSTIQQAAPNVPASQIQALIKIATQGYQSGVSNRAGGKTPTKTPAGTKQTEAEKQMGAYANLRGKYPDAFLQALPGMSSATNQSLDPTVAYQDWLAAQKKKTSTSTTRAPLY